MGNFEIILENFKKNKIDEFVFDELNINSYTVRSSHFFEKNRREDLEFHQIKGFLEVLSPIGTGYVILNQIEIGCSVKDVMIIFSFDQDSGDITFNFPESELFMGQSSEIRLTAKNIVEYFVSLKEKFAIPKIRFGFEPASDDDCCLVEIGQDVVDLERTVEQILR